jgi:Putative MetA-pathway of phenol degradation
MALHFTKHSHSLSYRSRCFGTAAGLALALSSASATAHGPLFSPAPETIWKGGMQLTLGQRRKKADSERDRETFFEVKYGLTANWELLADLPYITRRTQSIESSGMGEVTLGTKYQFWRKDLPGAQYKAAGFLNVKLPTADSGTTPKLGSGSSDVIGGIAAGYESRRWYWFASGSYRLNTKGDEGLEKGDAQTVNLVGGIRPVLSEYDEPDTVLMLEFNWERADGDRLDGQPLASTGGWNLFIAPVLWWTYRQVALRGGVQIPLAEELKGDQIQPDYRARLEFVYHF